MSDEEFLKRLAQLLESRQNALPHFPCGSPEMDEREYQIYLVACHAVGTLQGVQRIVEDRLLGRQTLMPLDELFRPTPVP